MILEIDFNSDEAIYIQLCNQIIMGIATSRLQEGDTLPSVRQLADTVGINMHTVNKAYSLLRQEGFVTIDRRRGAVISIDVNKRKALEELKQNLMVALAKGCCKSVSREEVHQLIDEIFDEYDEIENEYEKIDENTYMLTGNMPIHEVNKLLNAEIPYGDYDTLSGYLQEELGRIPDEEETPVIETKKVTYKIEETEDNTKGTLTCNYEAKSDAESQTVTYTANYEKNMVSKSEFNFVAQLLTDNESAVVSDLKTQYENFFINNAAAVGNRVTFDKNSKGFTFNVETNYKKQGFDGLTLTDNQTILFVRPQTTDTIDSLKGAYTNKGFKCSITNNNEE